ncbi:MAG: undecaprenyldiphospho-muramoylpentapeptide beta-N-acetylglucosaminyltransferase [Lachnospiraceae bacterium]|nr:undecaprenyldiphospho-muramoylpentapeptide beta-N-acetylglucosaminyltransferase [Lachnospiraceae bacterium]
MAAGKKRIVLTGGGTAGHVTPNMALIPYLRERDYDIHYIGSYQGIERSLMEDMGIPYQGIAAGKLRRYFSLQNFTDPFRVLKGFAEANKLLKVLDPDIVFSKGGFVAVPVVIAAKRNKIPVIIHESDITPGLANKLCFSSAERICCNFPETLSKLPEKKAVLTGTPIRDELKQGDPEKAREFTGFHDDKPVIMIMGGSQGSVAVNQAVRMILPELLKQFNVVHLCGKGKTDPSLEQTEGYRQYEYIKDELKDLLALSTLMISRAGANAICELLALNKPNILIPLSQKGSRGDQILNAESFASQGFSVVIAEEELTKELLLEKIREVYENRESYQKAMAEKGQNNAIEIILKLIRECEKQN